MVQILLKNILERKKLFVPLVFTKKQISTLEKHYNKMTLSNAEKKALYTSINKKIKALDSIKSDKEFYIKGDILDKRLEGAKKIIESYPDKKVFIGGSFVFSKKYNDIDIFIQQKRGYNEVHEGNKHIIFLSEKKLASVAIQSASLISVSNFCIPSRLVKKKLKLSETMALYHEAVTEFLNKEEKKESLRDLIFTYYLFCNNELLNGKRVKELQEEASLNRMDFMIKEILSKYFSKTYLYVELHEYIKTLDSWIKSEKAVHHLIRFKKTYEDLIYGNPRDKAEAY